MKHPHTNPEAPLKARKGARGFTLVELLVVTSLLGLLLGVIAASLAAGIRAWDAARTLNAAEGDVLLAMRVVRRDLVNAVGFAPIALEGDAADVRWAVRLSEPGSELRRLGTVRYRFDRGNGALSRSRWPYPDPAPARDGEETLARRLEAWTFSYLGDPAGNWTAEWVGKTNNPVAVRMEARTAANGPRWVETVVLREGARRGTAAQ